MSAEKIEIGELKDTLILDVSKEQKIRDSIKFLYDNISDVKKLSDWWLFELYTNRHTPYLVSLLWQKMDQINSALSRTPAWNPNIFYEVVKDAVVDVTLSYADINKLRPNVENLLKSISKKDISIEIMSKLGIPDECKEMSLKDYLANKLTPDIMTMVKDKLDDAKDEFFNTSYKRLSDAQELIKKTLAKSMHSFTFKDLLFETRLDPEICFKALFDLWWSKDIVVVDEDKLTKDDIVINLSYLAMASFGKYKHIGYTYDYFRDLSEAFALWPSTFGTDGIPKLLEKGIIEQVGVITSVKRGRATRDMPIYNDKKKFEGCDLRFKLRV